MSRPTIGFIIPRLGITDRGAEVFVYEIAKHLKRDFDVVIWVRKSKKRSALIDNLVKKGIKIKYVSCIPENRITRLLYRLLPLKGFIDKFHLNPSEIEMLSFSLFCLPQLLSKKVDLLFPVNGIWGSIACRIARRIKDTPFVYASQGGIEPLIARQKPNTYIAINPSIERWLRKHFPDLRVTFISNGVDLNLFSPEGEKAKINLSRPLFLTVSALVPEKQVDLTIRAVARLEKGSLLIIGAGPLKRTLINLADEMLGRDRYLFISIDHNDLPKYYRKADVFAHSAPWEVGWSIVHLEALASGLPVVANREENLEYLLGKDWPLFCNVRDTHDYRRMLEKATKTKVAGRMLVQNYSWERIADQYKDVLRNVIYEYKKR